MFSTGKYNSFKYLLLNFFVFYVSFIVTPVIAATNLYITSDDPTEFIGAGMNQVIPGASQDVSAIILDNNKIEISGFNPPGSQYPSWSVEFLGFKNQLVSPGYYEKASITQGNPADIYRSPIRPNLNITINGRRCDYIDGYFIVHQINISTIGTSKLLTKFSADFVQFCNGSNLKLSGAIRFESLLEYPVLKPTAVAGNDRNVIEANEVNLLTYQNSPIKLSYINDINLDASNSIAGGNFTLTYLWEQISGPTISFSDSNSNTSNLVNPAFKIPSVKLGGENIKLKLTVTNTDTPPATDTDEIDIHVISKSDPQTSFVYKSDPLEPITNGITKFLTIDDAHFDISNIDQNHAHLNANNGDLWHLEFTGTQDLNIPLQDTIYPNAKKYIGSSNLTTTTPRMYVRGFQKGCNYINGNFTIRQLKRDSETNNLTAVRIDFDQQCKTTDTIVPSDPTLYGTIKFNYIDEKVPTANAGESQKVTEATQVILDASQSTATIKGELTYSWEQVSSGIQVTLSDSSIDKPVFIAPNVKNNTNEELVFKVTVTDFDKFKAASSVIITVIPEVIVPPIQIDNSAVGGGGGGCSFNNNARFDATFYLMILFLLFVQVVRRRGNLK